MTPSLSDAAHPLPGVTPYLSLYNNANTGAYFNARPGHSDHDKTSGFNKTYQHHREY